MKKHFFFLLAIFVFSSKINAATDGVNALRLQGPSGYNLSILLDEQPVITFRDDYLVVTTHMSVISIPFASVTKYTYYYEDDETRINYAGQSGSFLSFDGKRLSMKNLTPFSSVQVYMADGVLVSSAKTDRNGNISLSVPEKRGAVYVVMTPSLNFKICKP